MKHNHLNDRIDYRGRYKVTGSMSVFALNMSTIMFSDKHQNRSPFLATYKRTGRPRPVLLKSKLQKFDISHLEEYDA